MSEIYNQIPKLLGYNDVIVVPVKEDDPYNNNGGIKIFLDKDSEYHYHYLSEEKLNEIITLYRESSLDFKEVDLKFDWKIGDMCYFEFKVHYITDMSDDRITGTSDGMGGTSGYSLNDRCFKINPNTLRCSNNVEFYYRWISDKWDSMGKAGWLVNFLDIYDILIDYWVDMIDGVEGKSLELNRFGQSIIDHIDTEDYTLTYNDINIFRKTNYISDDPIN